MNVRDPLAFVLMIVLSGIVGLAALASLVPAMFSVMLFDAPGSTENLVLWLVFLSILTFPLVAGASIVVAWLVFASGRPWPALLCFLLPLLPLAGVVGGFFWIEQVDGGQLAPQSRPMSAEPLP
ncbi:MAG: hypothetical protein OHK005_05500 [Candidatus Methylacidiphilales bacterium]